MRNSKDLVINKEGEEFLNRPKEMELSILNNNIEGNEEGELTYVRGMGCLVIDYRIVNEEGRRKLKGMRVQDRGKLNHSALAIDSKVKKMEMWNKLEEN